MKKRFKTNLKITQHFIDLTPLVDVIFLLLIFFIVTADILPLKSLNIQPPLLDKDAPALTTQLLVIMDAQNVIYVGSKKVISDFFSLEELVKKELSKILKAYPQSFPTIVLSIDRHVDYGNFLRLFSIIQGVQHPIRLVFKDKEILAGE